MTLFQSLPVCIPRIYEGRDQRLGKELEGDQSPAGWGGCSAGGNWGGHGVSYGASTWKSGMALLEELCSQGIK